MDEDKFYNTYPELKEFKNKIELLQEEPDIENISQFIKKDFKTTNIYTKKFVVIQN